MTSTNSTSRPEPFRLRPAAKDYLWGGSRLNEEFSKGIDLYPLAETWECSVHPAGVSTADSGPFCGVPLDRLLREHPSFLGRNGGADGTLPVLVKLIDAHLDLSVQVHPDDSYAAAHENGQRGKTEMWYVLDAVPGARIVFGLQNSLTREALRACVADGTIGSYLQYVPVKRGDLFFVRPGTIHAIGAGTIVAEIQQSSDLTYRLYDYDRRGTDGKKRPLHLEKALDVADLTAAPAPRQPLHLMRFRPGCSSELLCRCRYFRVERLVLNTERVRGMLSLRADAQSFQVLLCAEGCGSLLTDSGSLPFFRGDCFFVPADSAEFRLHGRAQFLRVSC